MWPETTEVQIFVCSLGWVFHISSCQISILHILFLSGHESIVLSTSHRLFYLTIQSLRNSTFIAWRMLARTWQWTAITTYYWDTAAMGHQSASRPCPQLRCTTSQMSWMAYEGARTRWSWLASGRISALSQCKCSYGACATSAGRWSDFWTENRRL